VGLLGGLSLFGASWALAEEVTGVSTTESVKEESFYSAHIFLNLLSTYHGSPLSNLVSSSTLDHLGRTDHGSIYFDNEITTAYLLNSDIGIGPDIPFLIVPVKGTGFIVGDLGIKLFDRQTVKVDRLNISTNLLVQAPTSQSSQAHNMSFALKTTPSIRYSFRNSRFAVGAWTEAKAYFGVSSDKDFKLYAAPYLNYQLSSKFSLNFEYEVEAHHDVGHTALDFAIYQSDFEPGFVYMISSKVLINPFIQIFTGSRVTLDNTAVGAIVSASL
jgi:hypothetical protein